VSREVADAALQMLDVDVLRPGPDGPEAADGRDREVRRRPGGAWRILPTRIGERARHHRGRDRTVF